MIIWKAYLLLQIICTSNVLAFSTGKWCGKYDRVTRTSVKWNNGQRMVSKRNFFGGIKYKYEPYIYSSIQYDTNYEYTYVCCEGYRKISNDICDAICDISCPINAMCIRPNECECNDGYESNRDGAFSLTYYGQLVECKPVCSKICSENSHCSKPNVCTCFEGYLDNGWGICKPICLDECPDNAVCTKPETCTCIDGYDMIDDNCQPVCQSKCPENSICMKPNQCECLEGFQRMGNETTSVECLAKCDAECPLNSYCHKTNECICNGGYLQTESGHCDPICVATCPDNSICSEPNKCFCLIGYEMLDNQCHPICTDVCPEKAFCKEPNKCECEPGYRLKLTSNYSLYCEPVCQSNCSTFGKCVAPNKCECLEGYDMDEMEICQPKCSTGCHNGLCYKPNVCICNTGYLMGPRAQCEPTCSLHCQNGSCIEPEICQCHKGFRLKENSVNICEPTCEKQCNNGICAAPNVCICHENYEPMETELGLNHNDCQIMSTTTEFYNTTHETTTLQELGLDGSSATTSDADYTVNDISTALTQTLAPAETCSDMCQCWQEYDDFGPLTTKLCTHVCSDAHDNPCLNLTLCQCDLTRTHLICRSSIDSKDQDDPLMYMCKIQQFRVTTSKSTDMKIIGESKNSIFPWIVVVCVSILCGLAVVGGLIFYRYRQHDGLILDYEL